MANFVSLHRWIPDPDLDAISQIDIGGAANFEGLRTLWAATKANNGAQLDGLHPAIAVRENSRVKNAELRLIVGPLADVEAAVRLCATLSGPRRYCQPVAFEGQRLADAGEIAMSENAKATCHEPLLDTVALGVLRRQETDQRLRHR